MIQFSRLPDAEADPWQQPLHEGSFQWVEGVDLIGSGDGGADWHHPSSLDSGLGGVSYRDMG